ncbi:head-tail connector protein [Pseudophaeobacter sp.]|uniref:head-tail connector protein n=1 Tax=Pseudophaeobacter sp. TaxID=1971739 RepID=UPI003298A2C6
MPAEQDWDDWGSEPAELMMMLSEVTPVLDAALPLGAFKAHLRLGTGFGEAELQDSVLIGFLRAALAAIEKRTGKALLQRDFRWVVTRWVRPDVAAVPIAPVVGLVSVARIDAQGSSAPVALGTYWLEPDSQQPQLHPTAACLPNLPAGTRLELFLTAGMSPSWEALPSDLAQAVLMLAAHYYEYRDDTALHGGCMPFGVTSLIESHRALRLSAGGRL